MKKWMGFLLVAVLCFASACSSNGGEGAPGTGREARSTGADGTLRIVSGSENKALEPVLEAFTEETGIAVEMTYMGSLDIMHALGSDDFAYDAVWPASSLWISLGDEKHQVKHLQSTSINPVVFGIRASLAEALGFVDREVSVSDLIGAINDDDLRFCMTSATQSNSGASAYIGFLYALAGHPDVLQAEDLEAADLQQGIRDLLNGVDRSSGSSDWLKDMFLEGDYDAMVNYEALIIDANIALEAQGEETLHLVYPYDGLSIADSPLGYVDQGDAGQEELFRILQDYLLSDEVQQEIQRTGRRTGYEGVLAGNEDVFRTAWGVQVDRLLTPIPMPQEDVIWQALDLYQTEFRKPSLAVYCLDFSGSMAGEGEQQVKAALNEIFDPAQARSHMLQASERDVAIIIPFHHDPIGLSRATGSAGQAGLLTEVEGMRAGGGTNMYLALDAALQVLVEYDTDAYTTAIVVMSDGESQDDFDRFAARYRNDDRDVPIFSILFGSADERQLEELAELSNGRVFDGRTDLIKAFKSVKGYY